jgi:uncharacterized protein YggT (Ycf19 family)
MSDQPLDPVALEYEQRARDAESSAVPVFLKIGRVIVWIVYAIVLVTAILLILAFFLELAGANPDAGFVQWVYRSTERAMRPFRGIFPERQLTGASVLDFSLLFAAIVYFVIALLLDAVLRWFANRLRREQRQTAALRQQADEAARRAVAEQYTIERAAREAAAREFAAQQAAAGQYAVAQNLAQEAATRQAPPPSAQPADERLPPPQAST